LTGAFKKDGHPKDGNEGYIEKAFTNLDFSDLTLQMRKVCRAMESDIETLVEKEEDYGDSWKKRGGVGAFMMLARKWDRIENSLSDRVDERYDIFHAMMQDMRDDGILDDIRDLRRYLLLVESEVLSLDE
tara:strand:- start:525 stop:914 length:390 start_codon:yes stop_codon:yes gene_type:complete